MKPLALVVLLTVLTPALLRAEPAGEVVTIQTRAPMQRLDDQGRPKAVSMSTPGTTLTYVRTEGTNLVLKDSTGTTFLIAARATNYTPPASPSVPPPPVAVEAPSAPAPVAVTNATPAVSPPPPAPASVASALNSGDAHTLEQLNQALDLHLLADDHFWDNPVDAVAGRLKWPKESQTATEASFRLYSRKGQTVLGAPAYSLSLYGKNGKPTYLSIVFSNAGDFDGGKGYDGLVVAEMREKLYKNLAESVKKDVSTISDQLTAILGRPDTTLFGNSASNRDDVHRWDWKGVSFLLSSHKGAYATLKIIPSAAADRFGSVEVTDRDKLKDILVQRLQKRDNGDVVITEIPMVDQGPKGYCVPATWERYLRYVDVPADLYVLAMLGGTGFGGGTSTGAMRAGVDDYVGAYHRRVGGVNEPLDISHLKRYLDKGLPLMWTCFVTKLGEEEIDRHTKMRKSVTDWDKYQAQLEADDKEREAKEPAPKNSDNGHMRMIIGYNEKTKEFAISDSWGEHAAERWITVRQANAISGGDLEYIQW